MDAGPIVALAAIAGVGAAGYGISTIPGKQEANQPDRFSQRDLGTVLAAAGVVGGGFLIFKGIRSHASDNMVALLGAQLGALGVASGIGAGIGALTDR